MASVYNQTHMHVTPLSPASANATLTAAIATSDILLADPLTGSANGWANDSHCYPSADGYHILDGYDCFAPIGEQTDGTESVTVKQVSGNTLYYYGLVFRHASTGNYDFFGVDSNSSWVFDKVVNSKATTLKEVHADAIVNATMQSVGECLQVPVEAAAFKFRGCALVILI